MQIGIGHIIAGRIGSSNQELVGELLAQFDRIVPFAKCDDRPAIGLLLDQSCSDKP